MFSSEVIELVRGNTIEKKKILLQYFLSNGRTELSLFNSNYLTNVNLEKKKNLIRWTKFRTILQEYHLTAITIRNIYVHGLLK